MFKRRRTICNFQVTGRIDQKILRLEVSIYDILRVQVLQSEYEIGSIEPGDVGGKSSGSTKM